MKTNSIACALLLAWKSSVAAGVHGASSGPAQLTQGPVDVAATGAAWAMIAVIAFVMGLVGALILMLHHRARHPLPHLAIADDLANQLQEAPSSSASSCSESWERSADWWRSSQSNTPNDTK